MPGAGNVSTPSGLAVDAEYYKKLRELQNKKWADCTVEEKLDKVREELFQLGHNTTSISNLFNEVNKLKEHTHDAQGRSVVPITSNNLNGIGYLGGASRPNNLL